MANPEHVKIAKAGGKAVDLWYKSQPPHMGFDLTNADLTRANLQGADLTLANLEGANLSHANLQGADLYRSSLSRVNLSFAKLENAFLMAAYLQDAELTGANLEGVNAVRSDFSGARLSGANLKNACLDCAQLNTTYLKKANLTNARIIGTSFTYAELEEAILDGVIMGQDWPESWWSVENVKCRYFFIADDPDAIHKQRVPTTGYLAEGEFQDRFKSRPTIHFIFENGMPTLGPAVLDLAISQANMQKPETGLRLLDITVRGGIPRAIVEVAKKVSKKDALALVEICYQQKMSQMQKEIEALKGDKINLLKIVSNKMLLPAMEGRDTYISAVALAKLHNVAPDTLRKRLDRHRAKHPLDAVFYVESQV